MSAASNANLGSYRLEVRLAQNRENEEFIALKARS